MQAAIYFGHFFRSECRVRKIENSAAVFHKCKNVFVKFIRKIYFEIIRFR